MSKRPFIAKTGDKYPVKRVEGELEAGAHVMLHVDTQPPRTIPTEIHQVNRGIAKRVLAHVALDENGTAIRARLSVTDNIPHPGSLTIE